jgi:hypothetical protein
MLLVTESAEEFAKARGEFLEDIQPEGAIMRRYAEDVGYLTWEIRRYRESKAGIINAAMFSVLHEILKGLVPRQIGDVLGHRLMIERLARGWFDNKEVMRRSHSRPLFDPPRRNPEHPRRREGIDGPSLPPGYFVSDAVVVAVMGSAQWHREFVAHLEAHRAGLSKSEVVGIRRASPADQARL